MPHLRERLLTNLQRSEFFNLGETLRSQNSSSSLDSIELWSKVDDETTLYVILNPSEQPDVVSIELYDNPAFAQARHDDVLYIEVHENEIIFPGCEQRLQAGSTGKLILDFLAVAHASLLVSPEPVL